LAHEETRVLDVLFDGERACGVKVQHADGTRRDVRAKVVVDASGQSGLLQNRFKLRVWDPVLNKGAIWTYWEGAYRDQGKDEGATIVLQTANKQGWSGTSRCTIIESAWVWSVPSTISLKRGSRTDVSREVDQCPAVTTAGQRTAVTGYFATRTGTRHHAPGDGWVTVGDAIPDPLYSSGAPLRSAEMAADAITEGLGQRPLGSAVGKGASSIRASIACATRANTTTDSAASCAIHLIERSPTADRRPFH
jgi:flavin-dependent dehydrogenase